MLHYPIFQMCFHLEVSIIFVMSGGGGLDLFYFPRSILICVTSGYATLWRYLRFSDKRSVFLIAHKRCGRHDVRTWDSEKITILIRALQTAWGLFTFAVSRVNRKRPCGNWNLRFD